jgi:YD repeat-containing protein
MKNILKKLILLSLSILAVSCSKDDNYVAKENRLLTETNEISTKTFSYNSDNKLSKITDVGDVDNYGSTQAITSFGYDSNGNMTLKTIEYSGNVSYGISYAYAYNSDGQITSLSVSHASANGSNSFISYSTFSYTNDSKITETLHTTDGEYNDIITLLVYNYSSSFNLIDLSTYTNVSSTNPNGQLSSTSLYSNYDTKKTPYSSLNVLLDFSYASKNNVGKYDISNSSITYTYEYNADGYPTKKIASNNNVTTFTYEQI